MPVLFKIFLINKIQKGNLTNLISFEFLKTIHILKLYLHKKGQNFLIKKCICYSAHL